MVTIMENTAWIMLSNMLSLTVCFFGQRISTKILRTFLMTMRIISEVDFTWNGVKSSDINRDVREIENDSPVP